MLSSIAQSLFREGRRGLFWPVNYRREKATGHEVGLAFYGRGNDPTMEGGEDATAAFDADFGAGFTKALVAFIEILQAEFQVTGLALQSCFGLDVREYSQLGYIDFNFLVLDGEVVCIRPEPQANEPAWTILRSQGIDTVYHLPSLQVALQGHFI